ncbi:MAG: hypothetical protein OEO83_01490 [Alphaproteobacteria bacterium]|nr:hypothetical protein [Alphaproteobacteria bacterium]
MPMIALGRLCAVAILPLLALGGCLLVRETPTQVGKTEQVDEQGRKVTVYRVCEQKRLPLSMASRTRCHTEKITQTFCYRSIGKIDCYDKPIPGRVPVETGQ